MRGSGTNGSTVARRQLAALASTLAVLAGACTQAAGGCPAGSVQQSHGQCVELPCATREDCLPWYGMLCMDPSGLASVDCGAAIRCAEIETCVGGSGTASACTTRQLCALSPARVGAVYAARWALAPLLALAAGVVLVIARRRRQR